MYKKKLFLSCVLGISLNTSALAESNSSINTKLSTLGLGVEYSYHFSDNWATSAGLYGMSFTRDAVRSDIKYNADLKLRHFSVLGHYYPWENGFRFSGGVVFNGTKLDGKATNSGTINLGGTSYGTDSLGSVRAKADFRKIAPYLGLGWDSGNHSNAGLSFSADLGVMFTGKPDVSLTPYCGANDCPQQILDAANRELNDLEKDLDSFKVYPVISIGAIYRF